MKAHKWRMELLFLAHLNPTGVHSPNKWIHMIRPIYELSNSGHVNSINNTLVILPLVSTILEKITDVHIPNKWIHSNHYYRSSNSWQYISYSVITVAYSNMLFYFINELRMYTFSLEMSQACTVFHFAS